MVKKVLIIGATGMVGQPITDQLIRDGHQVTALVRDIARARQKLSQSVSLVKGDIEDRESLHAPLANTDAVVIIMPLSVNDAGDFNAERDGTENIASALPAWKRIEILKLSEIGAGSDPSFFDLDCKAKAEQTIRNTGHPFVIFRPTWFMEAWCDQLRVNNNLIVVGSSKRNIHWVALSDMGRWISNALTRFNTISGMILTAQGRDALSFAEAAEKIATATGLSVLQLPIEDVIPPGSSLGLQRTLRELFYYYDREPEPFEAQELWRILGEPQCSFDEFVQQVGPVLRSKFLSSDHS